MSEAIVAGLLAGYGVAIPVGVIAPLIMSLTARTSLRIGASAALGVATADGVYALIAVLGGAAVAGVIEPIAGPLRWVSAAILIGLATHGAIAALRRHRAPAAARAEGGLNTPIKAYAGLLGLTLLNPMTIVYFGALVLGRQASDGLTAAGEVIFVVAAFAASASWQLLIAGSGSLLGRLLTGARGRLGTALASSAVLAVLAVLLVT